MAYIIFSRIPDAMSIEIGESRVGTTKEARHIFYESETSKVTFLERIKAHDIRLSQVDRPLGITLWTRQIFKTGGPFLLRMGH
jgi:hypothetical protein